MSYTKMAMLVVLAILIAAVAFGEAENQDPPWEGEYCMYPYYIDIDTYSLPVNLRNFTTCGYLNYYSQTCLGSYDGGEEMIFRLTVTDTFQLDFRLDPKGTGFTGMALSENCPPEESECLAMSTSTSGYRHSFSVELLPGEYWLMVDTYPQPDCLAEFDLRIGIPYLCGDADGSGGNDIDDVVYLIAYIFQSGPPCMPYACTGNIDGRGIVDIDDVVYFIHMIFGGGPGPNSGCCG